MTIKGIRFYLIPILIFLFLNLAIGSSAQNNCDIRLQSLKSSKKMELTKFWDGLREAIEKKDKRLMSCFFNFPFNGAPFDRKDTSFIVVTKKIFLSKYHKTLLSDSFIKIIHSKKIDQVLSSWLDDNYNCTLNISYPLIQSSPKGEGLQVFMTIKEIGSKFQIISIWTVP